MSTTDDEDDLGTADGVGDEDTKGVEQEGDAVDPRPEAG